MTDNNNLNFVSSLILDNNDTKQQQEETIVFEGMTSISAILHGIDTGINSRHILKILFDREKVKKREKEFHFLQSCSKKHHFSIEICDHTVLESITSGTTHGGIAAICTPRLLPTLETVLSDSTSPFYACDGFFVLLEGIEDPYNFGYTLRSLYAAGADGILLSPRNWMSVAGIVSRSSAGASEQLPLAIAAPCNAIKLFHEHGIHVLCAGIRNSVSMYDANLKKPLLLIVGGEKRGISSAVLQECDQIVRIDYGRNFRGSLSTASAATILAFETFRQNQAKTDETIEIC